MSIGKCDLTKLDAHKNAASFQRLSSHLGNIGNILNVQTYRKTIANISVIFTNSYEWYDLESRIPVLQETGRATCFCDVVCCASVVIYAACLFQLSAITCRL